MHVCVQQDQYALLTIEPFLQQRFELFVCPDTGVFFASFPCTSVSSLSFL